MSTKEPSGPGEYVEIAELQGIEIQRIEPMETGWFANDNISGLKPLGDLEVTISFNDVVSEVLDKLVECFNMLAKNGRVALKGFQSLKTGLALLEALEETSPLRAPRKLKKAIKKLNTYQPCTYRERRAVQRWIDRCKRWWDKYEVVMLNEHDETVNLAVFHAKRDPNAWLPKV